MPILFSVERWTRICIWHVFAISDVREIEVSEIFEDAFAKSLNGCKGKPIKGVQMKKIDDDDIQDGEKRLRWHIKKFGIVNYVEDPNIPIDNNQPITIDNTLTNFVMIITESDVGWRRRLSLKIVDDLNFIISPETNNGLRSRSRIHATIWNIQLT